MAGFGRTGKWFAVDNWDVVPGHPHGRQGDQLRLRPARRDGRARADRGVGPLALLRRRADLLGPSARVRVGGRLDRGLPGGGHRRERRRDGRGLPRRAREARREASVDRRGARPRLLLGPRARQEPRDARAARAVQRRGRGGEAGAAMAKRALGDGLYLMTHWNVVMVCPPLTITREELDEGIAILDDALSVADEFVD